MAANVSLTLLVPERSAPAAAKRRWWQLARREPGVSRNLALIKRALQDVPILASAEGLNLSAALTEREIVVGRAHWFGAHLGRYRRSRLARLRVITSRDVDILEMEFTEPSPKMVAVMYDATARDDFATLIARLQRSLATGRSRQKQIRTRESVPRARAHLRAV